jgi:fructokinase
MNIPTALVVGEALIDVVRRSDGSGGEHPGGSPMNVAITLGRLGRRVDLLTWFGRDPRGDEILNHLGASRVNVLPGSDAAPSTPVAIATVDDAGVATYEFDLTWQVSPGWEVETGDPVVVHTGSIAAVLPPGGADVLDLLRAKHETSTVTYDPNLRPALMGSPNDVRPAVEALIATSDVVKVSDEDLAWLFPGEEPATVARDWLLLGPSLVVVTHGGEGAYAITKSGETVHVAAPKVQVADTVGAGDSFMGGLIDGLWSAGLLGSPQRQALATVPIETVREILERCVQIAGITVSRAGANPPWSDELEGA